VEDNSASTRNGVGRGGLPHRAKCPAKERDVKNGLFEGKRSGSDSPKKRPAREDSVSSIKGKKVKEKSYEGAEERKLLRRERG